MKNKRRWMTWILEESTGEALPLPWLRKRAKARAA